MPTNMTYSSLVADLTNYLQRHDDLVVNQIPQFINLAQQRIPREMKILGFRQEVTGAFSGTTLTTGIMQKPSDWRKTIAFYAGTGVDNNTHTPVFLRDYSFIRTVYPDASVTGVPRFYGDASYNYWLVQPTPTAGLLYKIPYFATLTLLDDTTQTNWLTEEAPDLLLYASLLEAVPFLKVDDRIQVWQGYYNAAKTALMNQEMEGKYDTQASVGQPLMPSLQPH